ncbi:Surfactin synthase thioesterase subunit [Actinopolyspora mzabensis]|uniref:Surfactin synthase thioesterase subunit n=1 Tax=Actinopolyspora mzabensis TaxID=995066 RepID=A0A1G9EG92_ACTMZ|nr:alpha/beta fold hydrolase [Actinopolyspora mzabensis]SDK75169.1 Surfactin synthase thioesterase subunit [Actinopolyspora mzabensis]
MSDSPALRLFCLPYAGGSARIFSDWQSRLPEHVECVPLELPGRGIRFNETPHERLDPLLDELLPAVLARRDRPFALFGHSLGALLAFELSRRLRQHRLLPCHLFVSAFRAPHLPVHGTPDHSLPDEQFRARLREFNGTPQEVLDDEGLMELLIPILRADLAIPDTYSHVSESPLDCSLTAFAGTDDGEYTTAEVAEWAGHTSQEFKLKIMPGDHFFLHHHQHSLLDEISQRLTAIDDPDESAQASLRHG